MRKRKIVTALPLLLLFGQHAAYSQEPMRLLLGPTQAIDKGVDATRVDPSGLSSALKFILGTDPTLRVGNLGDAVSGTGVGGYQLTSTLQSLRDNVLWSGELRRDGRDIVVRSAPPITLGPVVLADEKGLKPSALVEIAALIKRQLAQEILTPSKPVSIYACLRPDESTLAGKLAEEFRLSFTATLKTADIIPLQAPLSCDTASEVLPENSARVVGTITQRGQMLSIEPYLEWKEYTLPLPMLTGESGAALKLGSAYVQMLSRATLVAFRQYPIRIADFFRSSSKINWQVETSYFFGLSEFPYLMVGALQRKDASGNPKAENAYEIGRAFTNAKEPEFARAAFEKALELKPDWSEAIRELGAALFELQRYDDAEKALKRALETSKDQRDSGIPEKYAQVALLLGQREAASRVLNKMFTTTVGTFPARLLAARIALDESKLDAALDHVRIAKNLQGSDPEITSRLARDIVHAALDNVLELQQLDVAASALDLIPETKDDVQLFALKGSVNLKQGLRSYGKDAAAREFATKNILRAIAHYRKVVESQTAEPDYEAIGLDISEAYYFAASYEPDHRKKQGYLKEAIDAAIAFLKKDDPRGFGLASYQPVAQMLIAAAGYLLDPGKDPRPEFARLLETVQSVPEGPHLSISVPTGKETSAVVKVSQWSFEAFDTNACKILPSEQRLVVRDLSDQTQKKVNSHPSPKPC